MDSKNKQELLQKAKNSTDNGLLIQISATFLSEGLVEEAKIFLKKLTNQANIFFKKIIA